MTRWTTVPPWLYKSDLPDAELQAVYVKAARLKVLQLQTERDAEHPGSEAWRDLDGVLRQATAFLEEAEAALARYRGEAGGPPPRLTTVRELPKP
jgi:hypothetical protein